MSSVYVVGEDSGTVAMGRVRCADEGKELQELLLKNPDLLPGDQIDPEDPRRWLLVRREMPVTDPGTGGDRWSIDFMFVDQAAMPTFVECKRMKDTRARREVVAQMLEYAANGHHYWTSSQLRSAAEGSHDGELDGALRTLGPDNDLDVDEFFDAVEANLREGQLRLVFFMEESPYELRSIVEFLNNQMARAEVLIVEARQFEREGVRVVAPALFGYTEQARLAKRPVVIAASRGRRRWNEEQFFSVARNTLPTREMEAVTTMFDLTKIPGTKLNWGTGTATGSFSLVVPRICPRSLFTIGTDGTLTLQLGWLTGDSEVEAARDELAGEVEKCGVSIPEMKFPTIKATEWVGQVENLAPRFSALILKYAESPD